MAREIAVNIVNASMATVAGYQSRQLVTEIRRREPCWSTVSRGWVMQPSSVPDLIALCESRGFVVIVTEGDPLPEARGQLW